MNEISLREFFCQTIIPGVIPVESKLHVNAAREHVQFMLDSHNHFKREGVRVLGDPTPVFEFLLMNGQEWRGTKWTKFRGRGYRKQTPQYCFHNSWNYSLIFPDLTYYEGYAYSGLMAVHHAWCVDPDGLVVDPTWRAKNYKLPEDKWEYFGVGFDSRALDDWMRAKYFAGVLYDLNYNTDVMQFVVTA